MGQRSDTELLGGGRTQFFSMGKQWREKGLCRQLNQENVIDSRLSIKDVGLRIENNVLE